MSEVQDLRERERERDEKKKREKERERKRGVLTQNRPIGYKLQQGIEELDFGSYR